MYSPRPPIVIEPQGLKVTIEIQLVRLTQVYCITIKMTKHPYCGNSIIAVQRLQYKPVKILCIYKQRQIFTFLHHFLPNLTTFVSSLAHRPGTNGCLQGMARSVCRDLSQYYTTRWICVLVTSNVPIREKKCNQLAFLPNA